MSKAARVTRLTPTSCEKIQALMLEACKKIAADHGLVIESAGWRGLELGFAFEPAFRISIPAPDGKPLNLEKEAEFYQVTLKPKGELRSQPHYEGTREFITVEQGRLRIESGKDAVDLGKDDSATYRADIPHAIINQGTEKAVVFLVVIYR